MKSWVPGHDQAVAEWASARTGFNFFAMYAAFGIVGNDGVLEGAAIFSDYYPGGNVELTYVGAGTLTRAILRQIGYYSYQTLGVSRITAKTQRRNATVCRLLPKAGFEFECIQKRYYGPNKDDDAIVYSLPFHKAERWLKGINHG